MDEKPRKLMCTLTPIPGVWHVRRAIYEDSRGAFSRLFCSDELAALGWSGGAVQINHSMTRSAGTVRGLHFQHPPYAEWKLVNCVAGSIFDVVVDLRRGSPTFMQWFGMTLCSAARDALSIPPGVAHGFQTLEQESEVIYLHTAVYAPDFEDGINVHEPLLRDGPIRFPLAVHGLSERDKNFPFVPSDFEGITV